jgi:hypothetical protein
MTVSHEEHPRILIGASSFADAAAALKILQAITPYASLGGLLVEEDETIALCQTLNQRIVTSSGMVVVAPDISQLRTLIEADAKAFRKSLAQFSEPSGAQWTFERSEGDLVQASLRASSGWDIIVLGHRNVHPARGNIVLLETAGSQHQALRGFADQLTNRMSARLIVFSVGQDTLSTRSGQSFEAFQEMLAVLTRTNTQAVLVDLSHGPIRTAAELKQLLEVARCPVFAFGATTTGTRLEYSTWIPPTSDPDREPDDR